MLLTSRPEAATLTVNAGGNLQNAFDAARPGDTIVLQAGATFTGNFMLPAKGGSSYITIRSSASDSSLPGPGVRIGPAYAGLLPKIQSDSNGPALKTAAGATYWRMQFLEFLPKPGTTTADLVELGDDAETVLSNVAAHLIVDRVYFHGDPTTGQRRGLALNSRDTQVINSYFSDFKGTDEDTQALCGWNGPGPFLIENNYLEAAGENIMFGGSDPAIVNLVPSDITIRRNLISKPLAWRGQGWVVKNLIELKNAERVLIEGNVIENHWVAGQQGSSVVLTPRNSGTAPWSVVRHVAFQNNVLRHVSSGFNIAGYDDGATTQQTEDILIRNNLLYDVSTAYVDSSDPAPARLALIGSGPKTIRMDHNTVDNDGDSTIFLYGGWAPTGTTMSGIEITNNLLRHNTYGLFGDSAGVGTLALSAWTSNAIVLRNTFAGGDARQYPTGNDFPTLTQWLQDFPNRSAGDYHLAASSPSKNSATDGKDLGVDFAELNAALTGGPAPPSPPPTPPPTPPAGSSPYNGVAAVVPGTIQAENYDEGGEGVAYHDTTSGNAGGEYRSDSVDLEGTSDSGGGYNVGWMKAGEWLNYTVSVTQSGSYTLTARVAANGAGGTFHVEIGGVDKSGPLTISNTGGWQAWVDVSATVTLTTGLQSLRVVADANGPTGVFGNLNYLRLATSSGGSGTPFGGTPRALPGTIQAEDFDEGGEGVAYHDTGAGNNGGQYRATGVDIEGTSDSGGGYNLGWMAAGEWLVYTVNVTAAAIYTLDVRVACLNAGGTFHIEVDGVNKTGAMTSPQTNGWQSWKTISKNGVSLTVGTHRLKVVLDTSGSNGGAVGNVNWIRVR
jgi:hypothetical protein